MCKSDFLCIPSSPLMYFVDDKFTPSTNAHVYQWSSAHTWSNYCELKCRDQCIDLFITITSPLLLNTCFPHFSMIFKPSLSLYFNELNLKKKIECVVGNPESSQRPKKERKKSHNDLRRPGGHRVFPIATQHRPRSGKQFQEVRMATRISNHLAILGPSHDIAPASTCIDRF